MNMQGKIQARGSIADKLSNTIVGRGLGPGRYHVPHRLRVWAGMSSSPLRHQARIAEATSTGQGCNLNVISVQNKRPKEGEEESEAQDGEMTWEQALYHVGWWTGLNPSSGEMTILILPQLERNICFPEHPHIVDRTMLCRVL